MKKYCIFAPRTSMQTTLDRAMPNVYLQWKLVYDCTLPLNDIAKAGSDLMHNYFSLAQTGGGEGTCALLPVLQGLWGAGGLPPHPKQHSSSFMLTCAQQRRRTEMMKVCKGPISVIPAPPDVVDPARPFFALLAPWHMDGVKGTIIVVHLSHKVRFGSNLVPKVS